MLFLILVAVAPGVAGAVVGIPFLILFGGIFLAVNLLLYALARNRTGRTHRA